MYISNKTVIVCALLTLLCACTIISVTGDNNMTEQRNQSDLQKTNDDGLLDEMIEKKRKAKNK